jgi:hypothetical protein
MGHNVMKLLCMGIFCLFTISLNTAFAQSGTCLAIFVYAGQQPATFAQVSFESYEVTNMGGPYYLSCSDQGSMIGTVSASWQDPATGMSWSGSCFAQAFSGRNNRVTLRLVPQV